MENNEELRYIISDECPADLSQNEEVEKWKRFLEDCHVDYKVKYIVANNELKDMYAEHKRSEKDCPEIDIVCPQIDTTVKIKRIKDEELKQVRLK